MRTLDWSIAPAESVAYGSPTFRSTGLAAVDTFTPHGGSPERGRRPARAAVLSLPDRARLGVGIPAQLKALRPGRRATSRRDRLIKRSAIAAPGSVEGHNLMMGGSRTVVVIDLGVGAAVELKFPRDPRERNAPDTMILGGLLNDFYRLARLRSDERWALQVIGSRLARHLSARRDIKWTLAANTSVELAAGIVDALPATARHVAVAGADGAAVSAHCRSACQVGDLTFAAYLIVNT